MPHFHKESALTSILPFPVPSCIFSLFMLLLLEIVRLSIPFRCQVLEGFLGLLFGFAPGKQRGNLSLIGFVYFSSNLSALKKKKINKIPVLWDKVWGGDGIWEEVGESGTNGEMHCKSLWGVI